MSEELTAVLTDEQIKLKRTELSAKVLRGETLTVQEISWVQGVNFEPLETGSPVKKVLKRPYSLSDKAIKQRQNNSKDIKEKGLATGPNTTEGKATSSQNARTHGLFAENFINSPFFKQCKSTCPDFPCSLIEDESTKPGQQCLDRHHFMDCFAAIHSAITDGAMDSFNELAETQLASIMTIVTELTQHIGAQGIMVESTEHVKHGVNKKLMVHPGIDQLTKLIKVLGLNFTEFMATPKSQDNAKTNKAILESLASRTAKAGTKLLAAKSVLHEDQEDDF